MLDKSNIITSIKSILREWESSIAFSYLFGSFLTDYFQVGKSDLDVGIYFYQMPQHDSLLELSESIQRSLPFFCEIDIVVMNKANSLIVNQQIITKGQLLTMNNEQLFLEFYVKQNSMYLDFKISRRPFEKHLGDPVLKSSQA